MPGKVNRVHFWQSALAMSSEIKNTTSPPWSSMSSIANLPNRFTCKICWDVCTELIMMVKATQTMCPQSGAGNNGGWNSGAHKLRMDFVFLNDQREKKSKRLSHDMWKRYKIPISVPSIRFYWHSAMRTLVPTICGCFPIMTAESSRQRLYGLQSWNYLLSDPL